MATAASFTTMPAEIVSEILGHISKKSDLIILLCVASFFKAHVLRFLYHNISIESLPGQPDQAASDFKCLQRLYSLTSLLMRPENQEKASLVRAFSFEAYMDGKLKKEEQLPPSQVDEILANAIHRGTIFPADSPIYAAQGPAYAFEDPSCADYILALLLPHLSRLLSLRLVFHKNSRFCGRMLHIVTHLPGRLFPRTAFQSLETVIGDPGRFLTSRPLWDNFNMFLHMPSVVAVLGHQQRFRTNAQILHEVESFATLAPSSSRVRTLVLAGTKRQARELVELVRACAALTTLALGFGNPGYYTDPWELLDLTDAPVAAKSTLKSLMLGYRESVGWEQYFIERDVSFSRHFTSFASFAALKVLKLGMVFVFDYQPLFDRRFETPLDMARALGPDIEHRLARIMPLQLEHLGIRRHEEERHLPLLRNVEHVLSQRGRFAGLKTIIVENMFNGGRWALACHELMEPSSHLNAGLELRKRAAEIGIWFMSVDNCPQ